MQKLRSFRAQTQKYISSRRGFAALCGVSTLLVLYFLGKYKSLLGMAFEWLSSWFNSFSPNIGFISDVIAVQGAVIAIAIPLSLELVSRISERYQSGIITKEFNKEWIITFLRRLVVVDILVGVTIKFFFSGDVITGYWKYLAWVTFLLFITTTLALPFFFKTLQTYTTDINFLSKRLLDDLSSTLDFITSKRKISPNLLRQKQAKFIDSFQGVGDILVFETKSKKNDEYIIQRIGEIEKQIERFLNIKKDDPELFENLLLSQKFFELREKNQKTADFNRAFFPEDYLISFTTAINQISLVRDAALEVNNVEIARFSTLHLILTLTTACEVRGNDELVKLILENFADFRRAVENRAELAYSASVGWYINVVYKDSFDISYLNTFGSHFASFIREVVASNQANLFQSLISTLIDSGNLKQDNKWAIHGFENLLMRSDQKVYLELIQNGEITKQLEKLGKMLNRLRSEEQLVGALQVVAKIKQAVVPCFQQSAQAAIQKELKCLEKSAKFSLKFNHLIDLMFDAGAYCFFKQRLDYIRYLWGYKQPEDSDAIWVGHNIVPETVSGIINFYFLSPFSRGIVASFWEDHHGSEIYYKQYFLVLLLRELYQPHIEPSFQLPEDLDSYGLSHIDYSADELLPLAEQLKSKSEVLRGLGFNLTKIDDIIDGKLIPCLQSLKAKAQEQITQLVISQEISLEQVALFKAEFHSGFNESVRMREISKYFGLYEDRSMRFEPSASLSKPIGYRLSIDKAVFFEEWYVDYGRNGADYGSRFARDEDSLVLSEMIKIAPRVGTGVNDVEKTLDALAGNGKNSVIFVLNSSGEYFRTSQRFTANWNERSLEQKPKGYLGSYKIGESSIPVFQVFLRQEDIDVELLDGAFLLLNQAKEYKQVQLLPDEVVAPDLMGGFYINIQAFSDNQDLIENLLRETPPWLVEKGGQEEQIKHLKTQVLLDVHERFKVEIHEAFEAYLLMVPSVNPHLADFL